MLLLAWLDYCKEKPSLRSFILTRSSRGFPVKVSDARLSVRLTATGKYFEYTRRSVFSVEL
jgi:hypothetical protein